MAENFKPCLVSGCNGNAHWRSEGKRGWCARHYRRWRVNGAPEAGRVDAGSLALFLHDRAFTYAGDDCLLWPFGRSDNGYGTLRVGGVRWFAHRYVCHHVHGPAPRSSDAAHSCGNRQCVNPRHLRWATRSDNMADAVSHGTIVGERHRKTKLTAADIPTIRSRLASETVNSVARSYGVTFGCIYGIKLGKNWSWVP